jgi:trans-2,3-dihydro-3-hydroxyanthranilate isomerase
MQKNLPFYLVDVFAENKLEGNQLAVFDQAGELSTETMQAIAKETNLA